MAIGILLDVERYVRRIEAALARRDATSHVVAFDLDGTLVVDRPRREYAPGDLPDVRPDIARIALGILRDGHTLLIVTGRETEDEARRDTVRALTAALGAPPDDRLLARIVISAGGEWQGTRTAIERKVAALKQHDAAVLVGDLEHLDGKAARQAGIPFVDVKAAT